MPLFYELATRLSEVNGEWRPILVEVKETVRHVCLLELHVTPELPRSRAYFPPQDEAGQGGGFPWIGFPLDSFGGVSEVTQPWGQALQ